MISASTVESRILKALDANTDDPNGRYEWASGIRDAVNYAIDFTMLVFDSAIAAKKISELTLIDLMKKTGLASASSIIDLSSVNLWSVLSFHPVGSTGLGANKILLGLRTTFRLTTEETSNTSRNCFVPGNSYQTGEMLDYAHSYIDNSRVKIYPELTDGTVVGVVYLKNPDYMDQPTAVLESSIEFPQSVTNLIVEKALEFIGKKEAGEQLTYTISEKEVSKLLSVL